MRNRHATDGLFKVCGKRCVIYARKTLSLHDQTAAAERLIVGESVKSVMRHCTSSTTSGAKPLKMAKPVCAREEKESNAESLTLPATLTVGVPHDWP